MFEIIGLLLIAQAGTSSLILKFIEVGIYKLPAHAVPQTSTHTITTKSPGQARRQELKSTSIETSSTCSETISASMLAISFDSRTPTDSSDAFSL